MITVFYALETIGYYFQKLPHIAEYNICLWTY